MKSSPVSALHAPSYLVHMSLGARFMYSMRLFKMERKYQKWSPSARLGLFLAFSDLHSSQVPLVLNIAAGHISPQFHVIFNDKFETVNSLLLDQPLNQQWAQIFQMGRECFMDIDYDENDRPILPSLSDITKQYTEAKAIQQLNEPTTSVAFDLINITDFLPAIPTAIPQEIPPQTKTVPLQPAIPPQNITTNNLPQIIVPGGDDIMEPSNNDNAVSGGETAANNTASGCPWRNMGTYKDGPSIIWQLPINGESYDLTFSSTIVYEWENPVPAVVNQGRLTEYHPNQKFPQRFLAECYLMQDSWFEDPTCMAAMTTN
jgi:hypothetical protein